jgi:hypothetical protein
MERLHDDQSVMQTLLPRDVFGTLPRCPRFSKWKVEAVLIREIKEGHLWAG